MLLFRSRTDTNWLTGWIISVGNRELKMPACIWCLLTFELWIATCCCYLKPLARERLEISAKVVDGKCRKREKINSRGRTLFEKCSSPLTRERRAIRNDWRICTTCHLWPEFNRRQGESLNWNVKIGTLILMYQCSVQGLLVVLSEITAKDRTVVRSTFVCFLSHFLLLIPVFVAHSLRAPANKSNPVSLLLTFF